MAPLVSPDYARTLAKLLRDHADAIEAQPFGLDRPFRRRYGQPGWTPNRLGA
ncbi:hypothetical protein ACFQ16_26455 [Saccharopolyspora rosea]|uniref:Uncharacterized protein n=1 Tax=Saccharopolyspora rosea TaxID=524884 RepID=A0ABW3FZE8_9PSEU